MREPVRHGGVTRRDLGGDGIGLALMCYGIVNSHRAMHRIVVTWVAMIALAARGEAQTTATAAGTVTVDAASYTGHDGNGIPHYTTRTFTREERELLRTVYGIEDPSRLYMSDSSAAGVLKYDTRRKQCWGCYVNSYRVGFVSIRQPDESWDALERRLMAMRRTDFPASARVEDVSTAKLDPAIRGVVEQMLADAAHAGFLLRVKATYRSPEREAYLMRTRRGSTHTLTSLHAYGRALDVVIDDGNPRNRRTRSRWAACRRWVAADHGGDFRILGTPDRTWDWPHVEIPTAAIGFRSIDAALERAAACSRPGSATPCDFAPIR